MRMETEQSQVQSGEKPNRKSLKLYALLMLVVALIVGLSTVANLWNNEQKISFFKVKGNSIVKTEKLLEAIRPLILNVASKDVNHEKLKAELLQNPFIKKITINQSGQNELTIEVCERSPKAFVLLGDNQLSMIDETSSFMPYMVLDSMPDMPLIRGAFANNKIDKFILESAVNILNTLNHESYKVLNKSVSELVYLNNDKTFLIVSCDNAIRINVGSAYKIEDKINKLNKFWNSQIANNNFSDIKNIDVRWGEQVITKN